MFESPYDRIQAIIGTDAGDRGMRDLIVPGDLQASAEILAKLPIPSTAVLLSGFPCCVNEHPPTETDGPPGTYAIGRALVSLGHRVFVVTDVCNEAVFGAALEGLALPDDCGDITLTTFPVALSVDDEDRLLNLANQCDVLIACERAGLAGDGHCYTMRGIDMNERGLIAPLHRLVKECNAPFIAIGDGGNELGMGKVIQKIVDSPKIVNGGKIGCIVAADHLIAASVSNWGGYALAASVAVAFASNYKSADMQELVDRCLPSNKEEVALLDRCVAAGCRDGVSGKLEATVDGMPLETSLKCLQEIRELALSSAALTDNK